MWVKTYYHKFLLYSTKALKAGCQLKVVVRFCLGNSGHDGNVVALWTDTVRRGNNSDVDVSLGQLTMGE